MRWLSVARRTSKNSMIDRELNYGREAMASFLCKCLPYSTVLDIGAGKGHDLLAARQIEPQSNLHAIECHGPNVAPESFDVGISNQTFEHLKEVFCVLHELSRVLKVGGHLIVGIPNLASLHNRLLLAAGRQPSSLKNNSAHIRGYTRSDFIRLLECFPRGYELEAWMGGNFDPLPRALAIP